MKTCMRSLALLVLICASNVARCQSAIAPLSNHLSQGSVSESSGAAKLLFNGTVLLVDVYAGGLDGKSAGVYILCCNADIAKASPATSNLLAAGDAAKNDVSVSIKPDTNDLSFWDAGFSGGDAKNATSKLMNAFAEKTAYVVITTNIYSTPTGEVSGQLEPVPKSSTVTIRNARGEPYGFVQISPGTGVTSFSSVGNSYQCSTASERCVIPVYVSSTLVNDAPYCDARVDFDTIMVPQHQDYQKGKKIRVVWELVNGNLGDSNAYRFRDSGIELSGDNDPTKDFNAKGRESADGKQFRWKRVGSRVGKKIDYLAWVERFDPSTGETLTCSPYDPTIANN